MDLPSRNPARSPHVVLSLVKPDTSPDRERDNRLRALGESPARGEAGHQPCHVTMLQQGERERVCE